MCGFFFEYRKKKTRFDKKKFLDSANLIKQRGPDESRFLDYQNISLKFFRLSIRDLSSKGSQPMWDRTKRYLIVFNGEIYNTTFLKKKLRGLSLDGSSDTEILINLYKIYGKKILKMIEGMFSFVIYDKIYNKCFIARDRFGIKPLYFYNNNDKIILSSEIKPIINYVDNISLNKDAFKDFFLKGFLDNSNKTFFKRICSLEPSNFVEFDKKSFVKRHYWSLFSKNLKQKNTNLIEDNVWKKLNSSIKKHLISDREVGLFLSGGTDSTSIAQIMVKNQKYRLKTFTYDFLDNQNSESDKAKKISNLFGAKNYNVIVKPEHVINLTEKLCNILESPYTSIRLFGTYLLYKEAKKKNIKVIIEGHGGDEMTAGYKYNYLPYLLDKNKIKQSSDYLKIKDKLKKNESFNLTRDMFSTLNYQGLSTTDGIPNFYSSIFSKDFLNSYKIDYKRDTILQDDLNKKYGFLKKSQYSDIKNIKIPRILKYTDRLSMNFSVESRVPLLDKNLFSYLYNLDGNSKFYKNQTRYIFKRSLKNEKISDFFTDKKKTIVDPQSLWLKKDLRDFVYDNLNSSEMNNSSLFNPKKIKEHYDNFLKGKINTSFQIFNILTTINFFRTFKKNI